MSGRRQLALGKGPSFAEDELRLPRPPGLIRRFWTRHPLLADILIAVLAFLLSIPALFVRSPLPEPVSGWTVAAAVVLTIAGCVSLVWRRRWPVIALVVSLLPLLVIEPGLATALSGPVAVVAIYSVAVYRGVRACWIAFGSAAILIAVLALIHILMDPARLGAQLNVDISTVVLLLLGTLIGINVGNRRRYLDALIDRSRQLLVERDQQAKLAAAAERTRIAREMHDIVSHSLTVVVALADGATATSDRARAAEATRAIAGTAREALSEMRVMLGVLRDEDSSAPLAPPGRSSLHDVVDGARATGAPVVFTVSGALQAAPAVELALLRIVKEGLTNAIRYSRNPSAIRVAVAYRADAVEVSIENDGAVVDAPSDGAGLGLRGLQERVDHVGGTLEVGMAAPGLWRLRAVMPRTEHDDL